MKVLLITSYFPPDACIGSTRWQRLGKEFLSRGHELHVITSDNRSKFGLTPASQKGDRNLTPTSLHAVAYPVWASILKWVFLVPIILSSRLERFIVNVRGRKSRDPFVNHRKKRFDSFFLANALSRQLRRFYRRITFPHYSWPALKGLVSAGSALAAQGRIDIIVATHPYPVTLKAASIISRKYDIPWIADLRDPLHNDHQLDDPWMTRRLRTIEQALLENANGVITINRQLADMLQTNKEVMIIPNCFEVTTGCEQESYQCGNPIHIVYTGNIQRSSRYRDFFEGLLQNIHESKNGNHPATIQIDYYGGGYGIISDYKNPLQEHDILLVNHGLISPQSARNAQNKADFLLVFGWDGPGQECVMTGKVFEYLATGKPIIAVAQKGTALADLVESTGSGVVLENQSMISKFIDELRVNSGFIIENLKSSRINEEILQYSCKYVANEYIDYLKQIIADMDRLCATGNPECKAKLF